MAIPDFESLCAQEDDYRSTDTAICIGKHDPISVSLSSNLIERTIFLCNFNCEAFVESFDVLNRLASQSQAKMKLKFLEIDTSVKSKINQVSPLLVRVGVAKNQYWNLKLAVLKKKSKMCQHNFYERKTTN